MPFFAFLCLLRLPGLLAPLRRAILVHQTGKAPQADLDALPLTLGNSGDTHEELARLRVPHDARHATHDRAVCDVGAGVDPAVARDHHAAAQARSPRHPRQRSEGRVLTDAAVVGDVDEIVELGAAQDARRLESRTIDRRACADLDVVAHHDIADLGALDVAPVGLAPETEAVGADHGIGVDDRARPEPTARAQEDARIESAVGTDHGPFADEDARPESGARADPRVAAHVDPGAQRGVGVHSGAGLDDGCRVDPERRISEGGADVSGQLVDRLLGVVDLDDAAVVGRIDAGAGDDHQRTGPAARREFGELTPEDGGQVPWAGPVESPQPDHAAVALTHDPAPDQGGDLVDGMVQLHAVCDSGAASSRLTASGKSPWRIDAPGSHPGSRPGCWRDGPSGAPRTRSRPSAVPPPGPTIGLGPGRTRSRQSHRCISFVVARRPRQRSHGGADATGPNRGPCSRSAGRARS